MHRQRYESAILVAGRMIQIDSLLLICHRIFFYFVLTKEASSPSQGIWFPFHPISIVALGSNCIGYQVTLPVEPNQLEYSIIIRSLEHFIVSHPDPKDHHLQAQILSYCSTHPESWEICIEFTTCSGISVLPSVIRGNPRGKLLKMTILETYSRNSNTV